jgi:hypothetical protein
MKIRKFMLIILALLMTSCTSSSDEILVITEIVAQTVTQAAEAVEIESTENAAIESAVISTTPTSDLTSQLPFEGSLLLLRQERTGEDTYAIALYELREGWDEPREMTSSDLDFSPVSGEVIVISPERSHLVFAPNFLLDIESGRTELLPAPDIRESDSGYKIESAAFSPDNQRLAYAVGIGPRSYILVVIDLDTMEPTVIHRGRCREYTLGTYCEGVYSPSWLDNETLIFVHHEGLPGSFETGSKDNPVVINHVTIMKIDGEVILSRETDPDEYHCVGNWAFRGKVLADAWFETAKLKEGVFDAHEFEHAPYAWLASVSEDGRTIITLGDAHWWLVDLKTGQETALGTGDELGNTLVDCLWSPDESSIACLGHTENQETLLLIPLSPDPGQALLLEDDGVNWKLFEWSR